MYCKLSLQLGRQQRRFLFASITAEDEISLQQKIESLQGKVVVPVKNTFSPSCTHVIAQEFAPTEKVLGALAGGKWLLTPNYVLDSYKKGYWLNEEEYEYTSYGKVAAFHRRRRELQDRGLYDGWKILVVMGTSALSRTYKRILAAGGADVATKEDISGVDFVLTTKEMLKCAEDLVDCIIPLVDVSYIKNTLIFRSDPADLKKCNLSDQQYFETTCKSALSVPSTSKSTHYVQSSHASSKRPVSTISLSRSTHKVQSNQASSKRPVNAPSLAKKKQICSNSKQTTLTQFLKPLVKEPSNEKPLERKQYAAKNNSVLITNSVVRSSQCNTQPCAPVVYDVEEVPDIADISKNVQIKAKPKDIIPTTYNEKLKECYVFLGYKVDELNRYVPKPLDITLMNSERRWCSEQNMIQSEQFKGDSMALQPFLKKHPLENHISLNQPHRESAPAAHISRRQSLQYNSSQPIRESMPAEHMLRRQSPQYNPSQPHRESVPVKHIPRRQSLQYNSDSSEELQKQAPPSKTPTFSVTKPQAKEIIGNFLRTRKNLSEVCCADILSIPRGSEHYSDVESISHGVEIDQEQCLDTPRFLYDADKNRELTAREINLYTCFITPDLHDQELHVHGLDTLLIQLSTSLYPPPAILGALLNDMVLETPFCMVHSRALRVAYRVLSLHSPVTTKMRKYYLCVLESTIPRDTSRHNTAWKFIQSVIQCASYKDTNKETMQNMEEDKVTRALNLLEFITVLITEDIKNSAYGEAVQELLTWDIFWASSKTCNILSLPVKQLLRLWMSLQTASLSLRRLLSQLVSVLLEVMWKLSDHPLVPVNMLPDTLVAVKNEIGIHIKGLNSQQNLELIRSLHIPWAQFVVTFIILQETGQLPEEITLPSIVDLFNSTNKNNNRNAVPKLESAEKVVNNQSLNMKDLSSSIPRSSIRNVNKRNSKGETALLRACIKDDVEQVKHLLKEPGVDITLTDYCGWTPLHEAALRGHVKCIKLLLNHNTQSNRGTLNSYFKKGSSSLKVYLNAADFKEKRTALHDAVIANRLESVKLLLDYGGEDLLKAKTVDGKTALDLASSEEMLRVLNMYKSKSVDGRTRSISPSMEDWRYIREVLVILTNCYLEVSGNRYLFYAIKKCIYKVVNGEESERVNDSSVEDMDYECQALDKTKKGSMKIHARQYLNPVENKVTEGLGKLEEIAVAKIYHCIRQDKEVYLKRFSQNVASLKKKDIKHIFQTLFLY